MGGRVSTSRSSPSPSPSAPLAPRRDLRRWIYISLDVLFGLLQAGLIMWVIPNRLPSAAVHLWTLPVGMIGMAVGMVLGERRGWWIALASGSLVLLSTILMIVRILISAAFLAGVYGAFGKAAAMTALIGVALIVELVALLPIVQIKYLMSRAGRRVYGMPLPERP